MAAKPKAAVSPAVNDDVVDDAGQPLKTAAAHDDVVDDSGKPVSAAPTAAGPTAGPTGASTNPLINATYTDLNAPSAADKFVPGLSKSADIVGDIGTNAAIGAYKGAASTGTGILKLGKGAATGDFGPFDDPAVAPEIQAGLATDNPAQSVGKFAEQMGEMLLPSGWVNRGIEATKGMSLGARIGTAMWREALADAGTSFVQASATEDPAAAAKTAAITGATGGLLRGAASTPLFLRDSKLAQAYLDEATRYGIPLTKAEQTQSAMGKLVEAMARRSMGGFRTFAKFDVDRNQMLKGVADKIVASVDPATMDTRSMGVFVKDSIDQVRTAAGQELGQAADQIFSGAAGKLPLDLGKVDATTGKFVPGDLAKAAQEIIDSRSLDKLHGFLGGAGGDTDSLNRAYALLKRVAKPYDVVEDPIAAALGYSESKIVPRTLDTATAKELRSMLFDMTEFSDSTTGKAAIKRLNGDLHGALVDALDKGGFADEAQAWEAASAKYHQTLNKIEADVLKPMVDKGAPEAVARVLNSGNGESAAIALAKVLSPSQFARVRGAMASDMVDDALHPNGLFMVDRFKRSIDGLGEQGMQALYGPQLAKELTDFATTAERFKIVPGVKETAEGMRLPFMAQLSAASLQNAVAGAVSGAVTGSSKVGLGVAGSLMAYEGGKIGVGAIMARMMTKPSVVHDLTAALTADPMTTVGKQLVARIGAYATKAAAELRQESERKAASNRMRQDMFGLPPKP